MTFFPCVYSKAFSFCSGSSCCVCVTQLDSVGREPRDPRFICSCQVLDVASLGEVASPFALIFLLAVSCLCIELFDILSVRGKINLCPLGCVRPGKNTEKLEFSNVVCFALLVWPCAITLDNILHTFTYTHTHTHPLHINTSPGLSVGQPT